MVPTAWQDEALARDGEAAVFMIESAAGSDVRRPIFFALAEKGYPVYGLEPIGKDLEDVFLQLVENGGELPADKPTAKHRR